MKSIFKTTVWTLIFLSLCAANSSAKSQTPDTPKTQVIIIGTIHGMHYQNPAYSPDVLREIILSLKPDAILNELPLSLVEPNGRPLESIRKKDHPGGPEDWATDTVATQLGIRQIPFDRPDRQENFKKTNYFEKEKQTFELIDKWQQQIQKEDPNSVDLKIISLSEYVYKARDEMIMNFGPKELNSEPYDLIIRIKNSLTEDIAEAIYRKYPGYKDLADICKFFRDQWLERNKIMAENIKKAAGEYPGKRLVVITGAEHRYILRDLLKDVNSIDLKEYWEIKPEPVWRRFFKPFRNYWETTPPEVNKPHEPNEPNQPAYLKPIPPEKLKEDLDFLFKTIEQIHPNMYAYTSKEEFEPLRKQLYERVNHPMIKLEFYKLVAPVVAELKNGHMNLGLPDEFEAYVNKGGRVFPLKLYWDGQKAILSENRGQNVLPMGGIVEMIDGQDVGMLIRKLARYRADEFKNSDEFFVGIYLHRYLWLEYGGANSWKLQIKDMHGKTNNYIVNGIPWQQYLANNPHKPDFSYEYLPEYDTGLIKFKSCQNLEEFTKFLEGTFRKIKEQKLSNLIIDIRHNVGGESTLGNALLDYITDKPFREAEGVDIKISKQIHGDNLEEIRKKFQDETIEIGSVVSMEESLIQPRNNPLRFKGKCYVLIDRLVFSSGCQFASVVKCFDIATVIGEETWGTTAAYGATRGYSLPNSGLDFTVPHKYIVQPCGKPDGRGVLPDYEIKQKPEDTAKGIDTALQFTLNLIKTGEAQK